MDNSDGVLGMTNISVDRKISLDALPFPASSEWDGNVCVITADVDWETLSAAVDFAARWRPPLDSVGVSAALNAVLGVWSLIDAANAVGLAVTDLVAEAEAWAVAAEFGMES